MEHSMLPTFFFVSLESELMIGPKRAKARTVRRVRGARGSASGLASPHWIVMHP